MKVLLKICFLMALSLNTYSISAQTLHAFVVMDDTEEAREIGAPVDGPKMQTRFESIAREAGMTLNLKFFKKSQLNQDHTPLANAIRGLNCDSSDAIFFYYTGHGVNKDGTPYQNSRYPVFKVGNTAYSMDQVDGELKAKNPRLRIIMYDACNWRLTPVPTDPTLAARNPLMKQENYQKLFKYASGSIRVASNTYGQNTWSYGENVNGGAFTRNFLASLDYGVMDDDQNCTWENILKAAKNKTQTQIAQQQKSQVPDYEINIEYKPRPAQPGGRLIGTPETYQGTLNGF